MDCGSRGMPQADPCVHAFVNSRWVFDRKEYFVVDEYGVALTSFGAASIQLTGINFDIEQQPFFCRIIYDFQPLSANDSIKFVVSIHAQLIRGVIQVETDFLRTVLMAFAY